MAAHSKVERFGSLALGGTHGYVGVRKVRKGHFQGYTPKKRPGHFTKALKTAHASAVGRAIIMQNKAFEGARTTTRPSRSARGARPPPVRAWLAPFPTLLRFFLTECARLLQQPHRARHSRR